MDTQPHVPLAVRHTATHARPHAPAKIMAGTASTRSAACRSEAEEDAFITGMSRSRLLDATSCVVVVVVVLSAPSPPCTPDRRTASVVGLGVLCVTGEGSTVAVGSTGGGMGASTVASMRGAVAPRPHRRGSDVASRVGVCVVDWCYGPCLSNQRSDAHTPVSQASKRPQNPSCARCSDEGTNASNTATQAATASRSSAIAPLLRRTSIAEIMVEVFALDEEDEDGRRTSSRRFLLFLPSRTRRQRGTGGSGSDGAGIAVCMVWEWRAV